MGSGGFLISLTGVLIVEEYTKKMRKSRFPPFGFVSGEFGLCGLVLQWFGGVFFKSYGAMAYTLIVPIPTPIGIGMLKTGPIW